MKGRVTKATFVEGLNRVEAEVLFEDGLRICYDATPHVGSEGEVIWLTRDGYRRFASMLVGTKFHLDDAWLQDLKRMTKTTFAGFSIGEGERLEPPPYPGYCMDPQGCAGKTSCPKNPSCVN